MENCGRYERILARFVHGEILPREKEEMERHLAACPSCVVLYGGITEVDRTLRDVRTKLVDPPPQLAARILANLPEPEASRLPRAWIRWAAVCGASACAVLALILLLRVGGRVDSRVPSRAPLQAAGKPVPSQPTEEKVHRVPFAGAARPASPNPSPGAAPLPGPSAAASHVQVVREVRIYFYFPPARSVAVTGDFNAWDPEGVPLKAAGKPGLWEATLRLMPGAYSYNLIVDGNLLLPDPNAANQMPDGYGGTDSVLLVKSGNSV